MTALTSAIDPRSPGYRDAAEGMLAKLAEIETEHAKALAGGGEKYVTRHHERGKLTARERIELLLDALIDTIFNNQVHVFLLVSPTHNHKISNPIENSK